MQFKKAAVFLCVAGLWSVSGSFTQSSAQIKDEADAQFDRLESKYIGNPTMQSSIRSLRKKWTSYRDEQCYFEKTAVAGGQVSKRQPPGANAAYSRCLERMTSEIKAALAKF